MTIPDPVLSSNVMVLNTLENAIINFPIYLISVYLGEVYHRTNYKLLDKKKYITMKLFLIFLILYKIYIPNTSNSYSSATLVNFFSENHNYLMLGVIFTNKVLVCAFLLKFFFSKKGFELAVEEFEIKRGRIRQYKISLILSFFLVVVFMIIMKKFGWMFLIKP
jgi:hypothetical protein